MSGIGKNRIRRRRRRFPNAGVLQLQLLLLLFLLSASIWQTTAEDNNGYVILTDDNVKQAVREWRFDRKKALDLYGHIRDWDTSRITDMSDLFNDATEFNEDLSRWDVSRVTTMLSMFRNAESFTGESVASTTSSSSSSIDATQLQQQEQQQANKRHWQTANVTDMRMMFSGASSLITGDGLGLKYWDVSRVTTMNRMFQDATRFNGDVSRFDVAEVLDLTGMFQEANSLTRVNVSTWRVQRVRAMDYMFYGTQNLKQQNGICFGSRLPNFVTALQVFCCSQSSFAPDCFKGHPKEEEILRESQECPYSGRACGIKDQRQRKIVVTTLSLILALSFTVMVWRFVPTTYLYERGVLCLKTIAGKNPQAEPPLGDHTETNDTGNANSNANATARLTAEELEARC